MALVADEAQYADGQGPCLDAARGGAAVLVADLAAEQRWPGYVPLARAAGVLSSWSLPVSTPYSGSGSLNLYGREAHAMRSDDLELAGVFAAYVAVSLAHAWHAAASAALGAAIAAAFPAGRPRLGSADVSVRSEC